MGGERQRSILPLHEEPLSRTAASLVQVLAWLLAEAGAELAETGQPLALPAPLHGQAAHRAALGVLSALAEVEQRPRGRLLAPDGRHEHTTFAVVDVDRAALEVLSAAVAALGSPGRPEVVDDVLEQEAGEDWKVPRTAQDLVTRYAQLLGVLDLAWGPDAEMLAPRLAELEEKAPDDVVLLESQEAAYQRLATRINDMWAMGSGIQRFLY